MILFSWRNLFHGDDPAVLWFLWFYVMQATGQLICCWDSLLKQRSDSNTEGDPSWTDLTPAKQRQGHHKRLCLFLPIKLHMTGPQTTVLT